MTIRETPVIKPVTHSITIRGKRISYQVVGDGEPMILVHGLSGSRLWWIRNIPQLAQQYRLYLVDLPGFGTLHFPNARFELAKAPSWLLTWMEMLNLRRAHFIGHSMGGYICARIAAARPEVVS